MPHIYTWKQVYNPMETRFWNLMNLGSTLLLCESLIRASSNLISSQMFHHCTTNVHLSALLYESLDLYMFFLSYFRNTPVLSTLNFSCIHHIIDLFLTSGVCASNNLKGDSALYDYLSIIYMLLMYISFAPYVVDQDPWFLIYVPMYTRHSRSCIVVGCTVESWQGARPICVIGGRATAWWRFRCHKPR
jgi:hypothetical protein